MFSIIYRNGRCLRVAFTYPRFIRKRHIIAIPPPHNVIHLQGYDPNNLLFLPHTIYVGFHDAREDLIGTVLLMRHHNAPIREYLRNTLSSGLLFDRARDPEHNVKKAIEVWEHYVNSHTEAWPPSPRFWHAYGQSHLQSYIEILNSRSHLWPMCDEAPRPSHILDPNGTLRILPGKERLVLYPRDLESPHHLLLAFFEELFGLGAWFGGGHRPRVRQTMDELADMFEEFMNILPLMAPAFRPRMPIHIKGSALRDRLLYSPEFERFAHALETTGFIITS